MKVSKWDMSDNIKNNQDVTNYLNVVIEEGDIEDILGILGAITRSTILSNECKQFHQALKDWLTSPTNNSYYLPYIDSISSNTLKILFNGITGNLSLRISYEGEASIWFNSPYEDKPGIDWVQDFDLLIKRTKDNQYYCGHCLDSKYYKTLSALWLEHTFNPLQQWIKSIEGKFVELIFDNNENRLMAATIKEKNGDRTIQGNISVEYVEIKEVK